MYLNKIYIFPNSFFANLHFSTGLFFIYCNYKSVSLFLYLNQLVLNFWGRNDCLYKEQHKILIVIKDTQVALTALTESLDSYWY